MFWRKDKQPNIRFHCHIGGYYVANAPECASKVFPEWLKPQLAAKKVKYATCPGMWDMARDGYIVRLWSDVTIKANSQGVIVKVDGKDQVINYCKFDETVVEGLVHYRGSVKHNAGKIVSPWSITTKKGYSAYVLPAWHHFPHFDKIFTHSGVVDYEDFHTVNWVFSVIEECEFTIPAGTPIMQVIPFKREVMVAECGKATEYERDKANYGFFSRVSGLYRRVFHRKKTFVMNNLATKG